MHVYTLGKMAVVYDLCIVGAGMVGSAAARHATTEGRAHQTTRVCLIGPPEPKVKCADETRPLFVCLTYVMCPYLGDSMRTSIPPSCL